MILVLGIGIVGKAVISYYNHLGKEVCFYDDNSQTYPNCLRFVSAPESWKKIEKVVVSPGVPLRHNIVQIAQKMNLPITNDIEIFLTDRKAGYKIGVTGTNGKSTLCAFIAHILGPTASIGGNFGTSPLDLPESEYYIIELSSFQLELLDVNSLASFDIGIVLNIYEHHIERHGSFEDYVAIKYKILSAKNKILGICDVFERLKQVEMPSKFPSSPIFKKYEYQHAFAIILAICDLVGLDRNVAYSRAESFAQLPHRQEIILHDPITIINDSKATNFFATKQAMKNMCSDFVWMCGGGMLSAKFLTRQTDGLNDIPERCKEIFVYRNENVASALRGLGYSCTEFNDFDRCVKMGLDFCISNKYSLLFSPACSSFDMFSNFEQRGMIFASLVKERAASLV